MDKKRILISGGIILSLIVVVLICYYHLRLIKPEEGVVRPVEVPPSKFREDIGKKFREHTAGLPEGGGIRIYEQAEPTQPISKGRISEEIISPGTFIDQSSQFPGDIRNVAYPPVSETPTGSIIPPSTMIENIEEFPQELE